MARERVPDLILLDWMMPETDGLQVLSALGSEEETSRMPMVMLTGKGQMGDVEKALSLGANDYITKPVDLRELGHKIKKNLEQAKP